MICVLSGGVGAAKLLRGLETLNQPEEIVAIVNTGDDELFYGLKVCPDLDSVTYALAGLANEITGWGVTGETFQALEMLRLLGDDAWFALGDRDLGTHLYRSRRLHEGASLTEVTEEIRQAHGITTTIYPMSETDVRTVLEVELETGTQGDGPKRILMNFQDYFVKHHHEPKVIGVEYRGVEKARPHEGVISSLEHARRIIIAPSNPILSIDPILAIPAISEIVRRRRDITSAISPIVGGRALKGPADRVLASIRGESSVKTIAEIYRDFAHEIIIDHLDQPLAASIEALGLKATTTQTVMTTNREEQELGRFILER